jgi:hypothetical protein
MADERALAEDAIQMALGREPDSSAVLGQRAVPPTAGLTTTSFQPSSA